LREFRSRASRIEIEKILPLFGQVISSGGLLASLYQALPPGHAGHAFEHFSDEVRGAAVAER
jgi:hypothetical protein